MTSSDVRRDDADDIITVTFTRDAKRNALNPEMFAVLAEALDDLAERDDKRVLVIAAEGRYFTAGVDISGLAGKLGEGTDGVVRGSNMRRQYREQANHDLFDRIEAIEKPVVLAPQGPCLGVGTELGASCDFRVASDAATFSLPEVANLAVIPGSGGISRLTRLVGPHWAKWLALACESVTADRALTMGFVHEVWPAAAFSAEGGGFAQRLAALAREAVGLAEIGGD